MLITASTQSAFAVVYESPKHTAANRAAKYPPPLSTEALAYLANSTADIKLAIPFDALSRYLCAGNHVAFSGRFTQSIGLSGPAALDLCRSALISFVDDYATLVSHNFAVQTIPPPFPRSPRASSLLPLLAFARPVNGNQLNYLNRLVADPHFFRSHAVLFIHSVQRYPIVELS